MLEVEGEAIQESISKFGYEFEKILYYEQNSSLSLCKSVQTQKQFAIKRTNKQFATEYYKTLISLIYPNIINLYDVFEDEEYQYLVMDYCSHGTMADQGKLSPEQFVNYAKQLLETLVYCHENQVAHYNIKPENIFIDQYNHTKLGNFGAIQPIDFHKKSHEIVDLMVFYPPEVLQHKQICPYKVDIWALGVTFFYMAVGCLPFKKKCKDETRKAIIYCELDFGDAKLDPQIRFLISKMITKNSSERPTAEKLLKFPIFTSGKFAPKSNLLAGKRRNSLTNGFKSLKKIDEFTFEEKNTNPISDLHCYKSIVVHPSIHQISFHHQNV